MSVEFPIVTGPRLVRKTGPYRSITIQPPSQRDVLNAEGVMLPAGLELCLPSLEKVTLPPQESRILTCLARRCSTLA